MAKSRSKILQTKYFGLILGVLVVGLLLLLENGTNLVDRAEMSLLNWYFNFRSFEQRQTIQEGAVEEIKNPNISNDIVIVAIDNKSLSTFGRWPFPRYREADILNTLSRIKDQSQRERAVFLDIFFIEPDENGIDDVILLNAIKENGRVFLETVLDETPPPAGNEAEFFARQERLYESFGSIHDVKGNWKDMHTSFGLQPPLQPYGVAAYGYGHANFTADSDNFYRRQALVAKSSMLIRTLRFDELSTSTTINADNFQRLVWVDNKGYHHTISYPITEKVLSDLNNSLQRNAPLKLVDEDNDGTPDDQYYVIREYQDYFVPSITLSLALEYFHKRPEDVRVVLGRDIVIPDPLSFDVDTQSWKPYRRVVKPAVYADDGTVLEEEESVPMNEIRIPIDEQGRMLINFMGPPSFSDDEGRKTYTLRSFSGYASNPPGEDPARWPPTRAVPNKILMVGPFARGMAADQKTTPLGLMYGVEVHANALNTIIMGNFIQQVPDWLDALILAGLVLIVAFMTSRLSTLGSLVATIVMIVAFFIVTSFTFDQTAHIVTWTTPAAGMFLTFLTVVAYRAIVEERDKRMIKGIFANFLSEDLVNELMDSPPELGGVDREITVLFSDIRGFTSKSEMMTSQELVGFINQYLTAMTDNILANRGYLDKYVGDEIMCFWGAPNEEPDHAYLACRCAVQQMRILHEFNAQLPEERKIDIGIGLNTGTMTVGMMGSSQRMDYTAMGDNVNLGARLEGTNKQYYTNIIISEFTYDRVKDKIIARELDTIRVKGKNKPVIIYELIDVLEDDNTPVPAAP